MRFAAPYIYPVLWNRQNSSHSLLREKNFRTMEFLITVKAIGIHVMSKYQNINENCRIFKNWNFHRNQHVRFNKAPTFYLLKYTKLFYIIVVSNFFWDFGSDYGIGESNDYVVARSDYVIGTGITTSVCLYCWTEFQKLVDFWYCSEGI